MNTQSIRNPNWIGSVDEDRAIELAEMFRLMGDPSRLRIILVCLRQSITVSDIAAELDLSQSLVSHHLRLLRAARILRGHRRGKHMYYSAADEHISCVVADMLEHIAEPLGHEDL